MSEKYNLRWESFSVHNHSMLEDLYKDGQYSDVTLISDDQTQFKAHKFVLSACSPVFKKIIDNNPSQHPLIYLRGIQSYELESILQFVYLGEGRFYPERMGEFIKVAKDLKVKEISNGAVTQTEKEEIKVEETVGFEKQNDITESKARNQRNQVFSKTQSDSTQVVYEENNEKNSGEKHKTLLFECSQCDYQAPGQFDLLKHIQAQHEGKRDQCEDEANHQSNLSQHTQSTHEGVKYPCNQCDYEAMTKENLRRHIKREHDGIRHPCDQCDYQAKTQNHLNEHKAGMHSGIVMKCQHCDFQTKWRRFFKKHLRIKHCVETSEF